jgi:acyl-CoA reductase-like NAD-dependent aldehyde dehydrogenase
MAPPHLENFIGGEYVQACTDRRTELVDPSTGEVFGDAPTSGQADVDLAYESAAEAFESWRSTVTAAAGAVLRARAWRHRRRPRERPAR